MYRITTPGYHKDDQAMRWALPDRVFFACGACHILAYAFLETHGGSGQKAMWLKPASSFSGNHSKYLEFRTLGRGSDAAEQKS